MKINLIFQILIQVLLIPLARVATGISGNMIGRRRGPRNSSRNRSLRSRGKFLLLASGLVLSIFVRKIVALRQRESREIRSRVELEQKTNHQSPPRRKNEPPVFHPFLIAIFPVLSLVSDNLELLSFDRKLLGLTLSLLAGNAFSYLTLKTFLKNKSKAGAIVSFSTLLFSTYGHVFDFLTGQLKLKKLNHRSLLAVWGFLEYLAVSFSLKNSGPLITDAFNLLATSLVSLSLGQIILNRAKDQKDLPRPDIAVHERPPSLAPTIQRDIYYIVVDAHASPSTLKDFYLDDMDGFTQKLRAKGFYIAEHSHSNYAMTMLSLASSLNLTYLHPPHLHSINGGHTIKFAKKMIEDNLSMHFLKSQGYETIFIGSGFGITQRNRHVDLDLQGGAIDESLGRFIQSTLVRPFADWLHLIANDKRRRILNAFDLLGKIPNRGGPKFVFAHIASPQWPFLFKANGRPSNQIYFDQEQKKIAYMNQLRFIDEKLECLMDQILMDSPVEPVIVLQADHGPNFGFEDGYDLQHPPVEILLEKMRILNAYYLPDGKSKTCYPGITPVNTFRLIFSEYFSADFPLLKDDILYSTLAFPHQVSDVSDLVNVDPSHSPGSHI